MAGAPKDIQTWLEFFQMYKENPCLWQKKYNKPGAQSERILAYNLILEKYWEIDKDATPDTMKKKITIFRGGVRRERKKIEDNPNYETKLWYYPYFKFIIEEEEEEDAVLTTDVEKSIMDFVKDEYQPIASTSKEPAVVGSKLTLGDDRVEPVYQFTAINEAPDSGASTEALPKVSNIRSTASPAFVTNVDLDDDDCGTFAAHIKARMRNFNPGQKIIAQKLISDILFMADCQQLQMGSAVVHAQSQSVGPPNGAPAVKRPKGSFLAYLGDDDNRP